MGHISYFTSINSHQVLLCPHFDLSFPVHMNTFLYLLCIYFSSFKFFLKTSLSNNMYKKAANGRLDAKTIQVSGFTLISKSFEWDFKSLIFYCKTKKRRNIDFTLCCAVYQLVLSDFVTVYTVSLVITDLGSFVRSSSKNLSFIYSDTPVLNNLGSLK